MIKIYDSVYLENIVFIKPPGNGVEISITPTPSPTLTLTPTQTLTATPTPTLTPTTTPPPIPKPSNAYTNWLGGQAFIRSGRNDYGTVFSLSGCFSIYSDENAWYMESVSSGPGFFPPITGKGVEYISRLGPGYDKGVPATPWGVSSWIAAPSTSTQAAQIQSLSAPGDPIIVNQLPDPIPNQLYKTFRVDIGSIDKETNVPVNDEPPACKQLELISCSSAQEILRAPAYNCKGFVLINNGDINAGSFSMGAPVESSCSYFDEDLCTRFPSAPTLSSLLLPVVVNGKLLQSSELEQTYGNFYANEEQIDGTSPFWITQDNSAQNRFLLAVVV